MGLGAYCHKSHQKRLSAFSYICMYKADESSQDEDKQDPKVNLERDDILIAVCSIDIKVTDREATRYSTN